MKEILDINYLVNGAKFIKKSKKIININHFIYPQNIFLNLVLFINFLLKFFKYNKKYCQIL